MKKLNLVIGARGCSPLKKLSFHEVRKMISVSSLKQTSDGDVGIVTIKQSKTDQHRATVRTSYSKQTITLEIQVGACHRDIERPLNFYESFENQITDILVEEKLTFLCLPVNMRHDWGGLWK